MNKEEMIVKLVTELLSLAEEEFQEFCTEYRNSDIIKSKEIFEKVFIHIQKMRSERQLKTA